MLFPFLQVLPQLGGRFRDLNSAQWYCACVCDCDWFPGLFCANNLTAESLWVT